MFDVNEVVLRVVVRVDHLDDDAELLLEASSARKYDAVHVLLNVPEESEVEEDSADHFVR